MWEIFGWWPIAIHANSYDLAIFDNYIDNMGVITIFPGKSYAILTHWLIIGIIRIRRYTIYGVYTPDGEIKYFKWV